MALRASLWRCSLQNSALLMPTDASTSDGIIACCRVRALLYLPEFLTPLDSAAAAAAAFDALAVCKSSGWLTAVPALSATVCAVISVSFVSEIQQTLILAVVCSALPTRCCAFAVSDSMAVAEFIDPGSDLPVLNCCCAWSWCGDSFLGLFLTRRHVGQL